MLVHVEIPDMSLNLQDPILRLTGIHPRQTGGTLLARFLLTAQGMWASGLFVCPGPARGSAVFDRILSILACNDDIRENLDESEIRPNLNTDHGVNCL